MVQTPEVPVRVIDKKEGRKMVEHLTRKCLDMSLDEFLEAWDAGAFDDPDDPYKPEVMRIAMLLPFVRDGR